MSEHVKCDIVNRYRKARANLRMVSYDAWLVEWIARRVARLLDKCDAEARGGDETGDVVVAGGRAAVSAVARARARANAPPV